DRTVPKHYWSGVIESKTVIRVRVSEQNRSNMLQPDSEGLLAKIGGGIDQDIAVLVLDKHRSPEPLIARVIRYAGGAFATYGWNANRCAGSEKSNPHCLLLIATNCMRKSARMFSSRLSSSGVRLPRVFVCS